MGEQNQPPTDPQDGTLKEPCQAEAAILAGLPMLDALEEMIKDNCSQDEILKLLRWTEKVFQKGLNATL